VRRVKYNCRSWGNWDFAVGLSAAVPVAGVGNWRDATCQLLPGGVSDSLRPALDGVGFSGIAG
jgi:hypothetical protein